MKNAMIRVLALLLCLSMTVPLAGCSQGTENAANDEETMAPTTGEIDAAPVTDGEDTACRYCEYHGICRAGKEDGRPLDKGIRFSDIAAGAQKKKL